MAGNYTRMDHYQWFPGMEPPDSLLEKLQEYDLVLAAIYPGNTHLSMESVEKLTDYSAGDRQLVVVSFDGAVDQGPLLSMWREAEGLVAAYQHNPYTEELAAQLLFGGIGARGRLPVAAGEDYPAGSGINTQGELRLQYAYPENAGFSSRVVQRSIDSIVHAGLVEGAFPGCEIMAARQGKVIFHKTYGHHTYNRRIAVSKQDLYDLASVTKISGPLSGLMVLEGMGRFSHRDQLGTYAPAMKRSDKADLWLKEVLAHQAGLYPWIPYWRDAVRDNGKYRKRFLRYTGDQKYPVVVAEHLYLKHNFKRRIYRTIRKSELGEKEYLYSGLAFFLFPEIIEDLSGDRYEDFLYRQVYHRIGAWDLVFNPWRSYPGSQIVPTEYDSLFRKQQVHGYVHDEGAAMMGGYSGNAGLFATANDLMKLMEMYRRMGSYGGEEIIPAGVLQEYTSYQFPGEENRRGLGFDKPLLGERDGTPGDYPCPGASPSSFGHSGFTGTFAWVDPEYEITYVFLSNRVYPTRENNLISEMDIRTSILQSLYNAIGSGE
jgi:CubicO group peptidase (beta-lactamase class C family)